MVDQQRLAPGSPSGGAFGPNAWLVDDMYEEFRSDPSSVSESWREFFADYSPPGLLLVQPCGPATGNGAPAPANGPSAATEACAPGRGAATARRRRRRPPSPCRARTRGARRRVAPVQRPPCGPPPTARRPDLESDDPAPVPLRGAAARIVVNMEASLAVPTATSVRTVPAKLLEVNRSI
jgi:2-oxoglutarate decarboxylase